MLSPTAGFGKDVFPYQSRVYKMTNLVISIIGVGVIKQSGNLRPPTLRLAMSEPSGFF